MWLTRRGGIRRSLVVASAAACGSGSGAASPSAAADASLDQALDRIVARTDGPPGIAVVVQRGATPVLHSVGTSVVGASTPITLTDHLRIASVAKAFSGAVSLDAVVAGKLSLDDTVVRRFRRRRSRASVLDSTAAISTPNGVAAM